jgi:chromate transport protein ChrA
VLNSSPTVIQSSTQKPVPLLDLFLQFLYVGAVSFGGGIIAYERILLVEKRKWLNADQFMAYLAISQTMPGLNSVNLAVLTGDYSKRHKGINHCLTRSGTAWLCPGSLAGLYLYRTNGSRDHGFIVNGDCGRRYWPTGCGHLSDW